MKNMHEIKISVLKDFSESPGGRIPEEGPYSGQEFREKILLPALNSSAKKIFIDLDGTDGYGSSFLEEAFGGLVRAGYSPEDLIGRIEFKSEDDDSVSDEIILYIKQAK